MTWQEFVTEHQGPIRYQETLVRQRQARAVSNMNNSTAYVRRVSRFYQARSSIERFIGNMAARSASS